jgi:hypothetical protein
MTLERIVIPYHKSMQQFGGALLFEASVVQREISCFK